jgi:hypothetical protein
MLNEVTDHFLFCFGVEASYIEGDHGDLLYPLCFLSFSFSVVVYAPPVARYCSLPLPAIFRCRFSSLSFPLPLTWSRWVEVTLCEELVEGLAEFIFGGDRVAVVDCFFSSLEEFACGGDRISEVAEFLPSSFLFQTWCALFSSFC